MTYKYRGGQTVPPTGPGKAGLIPLDRIVFHPHNVRRDLGDLRELTESIRRHGVITPVVLEVRGEMFRIRAGHRRVAAARLADLKRIPAFIHGAQLDDAAWMVNSIQENHHRRGLDRADRRDAIERLRDEGLTWEEIATEFGAAVSTVQRWAKDDDDPAAGTSPRRLPSTVGRRRLTSLIDELRADVDHLTAADVLDRVAALANGEHP